MLMLLLGCHYLNHTRDNHGRIIYSNRSIVHLCRAFYNSCGSRWNASVFQVDGRRQALRGASLCIFCRKCIGRCNWSSKFEAVEGWTALVKYGKHGIRRAWVSWCPEFVPDKGLKELILYSNDIEKLSAYLNKTYGRMTRVRIAVLRYHLVNSEYGRRNDDYENRNLNRQLR